MDLHSVKGDPDQEFARAEFYQVSLSLQMIQLCARIDFVCTDVEAGRIR
jgi:hypothetical protein